jgi:biopolymer transport protein ExbD
MAASSGSDPDDMIATINVTPLVDIMLVLLVVFMVTARLMNQDKSVPMDLPRAASAKTEQTVWTVAVQKDGETRVNGELVQGKGALRDRARAALARTPELRAVIAASRHTEHGAVVTVLDELRQGGLTRVAFGASPEDSP